MNKEYRLFSKRHFFHIVFRLKVTIDSGINIRVRLVIFEKKIEAKKNDCDALSDVKMN